MKPDCLVKDSPMIGGTWKASKANINIVHSRVVLIGKGTSCRRWLRQIEYRKVQILVKALFWDREPRGKVDDSPLFCPLLAVIVPGDLYPRRLVEHQREANI